VQLKAEGEMADLDDSPEQAPLPLDLVQATVISLLGGHSYDMLLTHGPKGEYTRHRRHEECCQSVVNLWKSSDIRTKNLLLFAYEDGDRAYLPRVRKDADQRYVLKENIWREKRRLIMDVYGYGEESWEARSTPREEGFWRFNSPQAAFNRTVSLERKS
jgi:hypothetical protein